MHQAIEGIERLKQRAAQVGAPGNRQYNPGWHTALDLNNLLTCAEAVTRSAIERRESRGAHCRDDYPGQGRRTLRKREHRDATGKRRANAGHPGNRFRRCQDELKQVIEDHR